MKLIIIPLLIFLCSCGETKNHKGNSKSVNLYVAGCDSIFYCSKESFDQHDLIAAKKDDSIFINKIIAECLDENNKISCKPFGGNCGGVGGTTLALAEFFKAKSIPFAISQTTSIEEKYFRDVPLLEALKEFENNETIILPEPKKEERLPLKQVETALTIIISSKNELFFYRGDNCNQMQKTDFKNITKVIQKEKNSVVLEDLMFIIKTTKTATFNAAIDLIDQMVLCNIKLGHYQEAQITNYEINCITNYKD
jgi:hypothetical protein